jgi:hypothetical protein
MADLERSRPLVEQIVTGKLRQGVPAIVNEMQLIRCITEQKPQALHNSNMGNTFINGLDVVCLQTSNLDSKAKFKLKRLAAIDCLEAYADSVELMSEMTFTQERISQRIEELVFDDSEFLKSYDEFTSRSTA